MVIRVQCGHSEHQLKYNGVETGMVMTSHNAQTSDNLYYY